jgi:hypothetical protein
MGDSERTNVIVVGAGASQEFGLPTGAELTKIIQNNLAFEVDIFGTVNSVNGDYELLRAVDLLANELNVRPQILAHAAKKISKNMALAPSIDNFLDTHKEDLELVAVGKLAIAYSIMNAERRSCLYVDSSNVYNTLDFSVTTNTWASVFFKIIAAKRDYVSFLKALNNITFISFNYDRCIKQFFGNAAASYFALNDGQTTEVLQAIKVIHPYGSIGDLEVKDKHVSGYAPEVSGSRILSSSKKIRTFTEGVQDARLLQEITLPIGQAEVIIFLGFSFIDINMQLLVPEVPHSRRVLATAKGRSEDTRLSLRQYIGRRFTSFNPGDDAVEMFDGKCFELFYEYDRYLERSQPK